MAKRRARESHARRSARVGRALWPPTSQAYGCALPKASRVAPTRFLGDRAWYGTADLACASPAGPPTLFGASLMGGARLALV